MKKMYAIGAAAVVAALLFSSCAASAAFGEDLTAAFKGRPATVSTYDQDGQMIDQVHGTSFRVSRDTQFDMSESNSDGTVTEVPGQVLMISVGDSHISHVGSSMILAQDGLQPIANADTFLRGENSKAGIPILNDLREQARNLWKGKAKTILIRSQNGTPIAVYAGNEVEVYPSDVPKSTRFRVDDKYLWVYRVDYTTFDSDLLDTAKPSKS